MMLKIASVAAFFVSTCYAFVPVMNAESGVSRADFAKVLAAGVVGAAAPAFALGASPKQSFFGVIGTGPDTKVGGGGFSSPYAEIETYSPYSPYSATEDGTAMFKGATDEMTKSYIATIKDCKSRLEKIPGWAKEKKWMEINAELTRKAYNLRGAMRALAKTPESQAAAAKYFQDLEVMATQSRNKNGDQVLSAYNSSVADLTAYLGTL